jgi:replication-associated recombination protein RarA
VAERPPDTPHGHDAYEAVSALQKAIRRGDAEGACYWAWQLEAAGLGAWLWARLRVIDSEDCAVDPHLPATIEALHGRYRDFARNRKGDALLVVLHAVVLLAEAPKSRLPCWMAVAMDGGAVPKREVPDHALDRHTRRGKAMGRGWEQFWSEASHLEHHRPHELEAKYRDLAREAVEHPQDRQDPPANERPQLFDE